MKRGGRVDCFRKSRNKSSGAGRKMSAQPGAGLFACGKTDNRKAAQIPTMAT
jgi:hypothetical protein